jgi:hypothetical protein
MEVLGSSSGALRTETQYLEEMLRVMVAWAQDRNQGSAFGSSFRRFSGEEEPEVEPWFRFESIHL